MLRRLRPQAHRSAPARRGQGSRTSFLCGSTSTSLDPVQRANVNRAMANEEKFVLRRSIPATGSLVSIRASTAGCFLHVMSGSDRCRERRSGRATLVPAMVARRRPDVRPLAPSVW
jgi:hypothetical protein